MPTNTDRHSDVFAPFDVINPSTEALLRTVPGSTVLDLQELVDAAEAAFPAWSADADFRTKVLLECAERIKAHAGELGELMTQEMGKPIASATEEAFIAGILFEVNAGLPLEPEQIAESPSHVVVHRRPLGVVAAIAPWNWPLGLAMWKVAPALRAGNTVILKPSPFAPLSTLRLAALIADLFPPGVFTVACGDDDLGRWLVSNPKIARVAFTGSVASGIAIASSCALDLKRVSLELGGNDAAIVLEDADVQAIADQLFWGAFTSSGQVCGAIKRLYVVESQFEAVVQALHARAKTAVVGDPLQTETQLGPLGNSRQLARVEGLVADAVASGAHVVCGGKRLDRPGYFYPPTLMTKVDESMALVAEEQFGPVLPIIAVANAEEAVSRANNSRFGLGGSMWTQDVERGAKLAAQLQVGTAWVNQHFVLEGSAPFGGWKHSGLGRENGLYGLHSFTELQVVSVAEPKA
jgi:acyl-CoA reductase-like NAD-dependent aldehyde dehydrogenase